MNLPGNTYRDIPFFLVLIPLVNALNYYLTYSSITFSGHTLLTFSIDTLQGYAAWWVIRMIIIRLDKKLPYSPRPLKRIGRQLLFTITGSVGLIIGTTEIINWIATDKPVPASFYRLDIFIFAIWALVINGIYIGLHYFLLWNEAERARNEEKKVRQDGFQVKQGKQSLLLPLAEIAGIYVEGSYAVLLTREGKKYLLDQSLDKVEKSLPPESFFRLNRQYLLHRHMITGYERADDAKINILLKPLTNLPGVVQMSRTKAPAFKAWFQQAD